MLQRLNVQHSIKTSASEPAQTGNEVETVDQGQEVDDELGQKEEIMHDGVNPTLEATLYPAFNPWEMHSVELS